MAPTLRVATRAIKTRGDNARVNLERLGGRLVFAYGPTDDESAILDLPTRRVLLRGHATPHETPDGARFVLARSNPQGGPITKWSVDANGRLLSEPWTRQPLRPSRRGSEHWRAPLELTFAATKQLCKVKGWVVPKESCTP